MTPSIKLTPRDHEVLAALGSYRFLSAFQVAELAFPSEGSAAKRLRELAHHGLVVRLPIPVRSEASTPSSVWALKPLGARHVAMASSEKPPSLKSGEERTSYHLEHTLARNTFRLVLERLSQLHPKITLLAWRQDKPDVRRSVPLGMPGGQVVQAAFIPDGVAILRVGHEVHVLAVEIDRGTVSKERMALRYRAYFRYWKDGSARREYGASAFRVLTVTTNDRWLLELEARARAAPPGKSGTKLFWFAKTGDIDLRKPEGLLDPIWSVATRNRMAGERLFPPKLLQS